MLSWLIPYLVAYTSIRGHSGEGKYGLEHVFKAEVYNNITIPEEACIGFSEVRINFSCRPMNSSVIQCRTDSASMDKYDVPIGSTTKKESAHYDDIGINGIIFQVEFDEAGISTVWFLNEDRSTKRNMIRAIIEPMSLGMKIDGKELKNYVSSEKSLIGTCTTNVNIKKKFFTKKETKNETMIEGFTFDRRIHDVPPFGSRNDLATIVIEKDRNVDDCEKETPHFFGATEEEDAKHGYTFEKHMTYSKSEIFLGEKSFSAYTEHLGTIADHSPQKSEKMMAGQMIRLSLQSIRPAKEKLWMSQKGVGAGFEPGTPWPERNVR